MDDLKLAIILILVTAQIALIYLFQNYIGINGIEWAVWIGYSLATAFVGGLIKGVAQG